MNISNFFVGLLLSTGSLAWGDCTAQSLAARIPQTGQVECLERWKPGTLLVVAEINCEPCRKLLHRIKGDLKRELQVTILWLEANDKYCLEAALKVSGFAKSYCASIKDVGQVWAIQSTPRMFWLKGKDQKEQVGLVEDPLNLPWNVSESLPVIK